VCNSICKGFQFLFTLPYDIMWHKHNLLCKHPLKVRLHETWTSCTTWIMCRTTDFVKYKPFYVFVPYYIILCRTT
jgi:hypothetical protein